MTTDFGTPAVNAATRVALTIDGIEVDVPAGTSLMRAAATAGIQIPRLCATDCVTASGACRMCLVQIDGKRGYPASCTTPAEAGLVVHTTSPHLTKLRRGVLELYVSEHPLACGGCGANGDCELQSLARAHGVGGPPPATAGAPARVGIIKIQLKRPATAAPATPATPIEISRPRNPATRRDESNPYFTFDPSMCIACGRCVRACGEVQGTFALTLAGRGPQTRLVASQDETFLSSECVSCGACVKVCPTVALREKTVLQLGLPERSTTTTCAYCGVGCSFDVQTRGTGAATQILRMQPNRDHPANRGHACVKGRFAWSYATHKDRLRTPLMRKHIDEPWREVGWDEALAHVASEFRRIQTEFGRGAVGAITSSRCTNEEVWLVQKLVRTGFLNNNTDTCARVCHAPTGYGLKATLGESAGTQTFDSVAQADVIFLIGANPTDAHPVFGARMKRRLREGARLIVADPRRIDLVRSPHVAATQHLQLRPGTNVALINALAHVIVTEGLVDEAFVRARCEPASFEQWRAFVAEPENSPEATASITGVPAANVRAAARLYATADNAAIYYGLGVTEHSQGSTMVIAIANLAMATGNLGREGVGVSPLRGQNNVQGSCDMGSFPHDLPGYRHVGDDAVRATFERDWNVVLDPEPGLRISNMFDAALAGSFLGLYIQGEDVMQSDPDTQHVEAALRAMQCVVLQDIFLNETARFAHVVLPGSSFLEKDGTFTNAERRISPVRAVLPPLAGLADWQVTQRLAQAMGLNWNYTHPRDIMDEIARLTPTFAGVDYDKIDRLGSLQWPCNDESPEGTPTMHVEHFVRGLGRFMLTRYVPTDERASARFPLLLTTGRILSQYNVGAQTRRTANGAWHDEDRLDIHPHDAELRGIRDGDAVGIESRAGATTMHARLTERVPPGVVYTTFHHPESGANVVTTDNSDWATNCPEYKVTAVQVRLVMAEAAAGSVT